MLNKKIYIVITAVLALSMLLILKSISSATESTTGNNETIIKNDKATIDFKNTSHTGTVSINYNGSFSNRLKVRIIKNNVIYTYDLKNNGTAEVYPLQMGNGSYKISVMAQTSGTKYATALTTDYTLKLSDANAPFLNASQYVNFNKKAKTVSKAKELTKGCKTDQEKVTKIYSYIIKNISYDTKKAKTVQSGYLPVLDTVLSTKKGICFDYGALLAAMLRSVDIPTKLVVGWVTPDKNKPSNKVYHAWNEFYVKDVGWFKINEMKIEGGRFSRVDSTFDSSSKSSSSIMKFIGDGTNYDTAYIY